MLDRDTELLSNEPIRINECCKYDDLLSVDELKAKFDPHNTNTHSEDSIRRMGKVLIFQGFDKAVIISTNTGVLNQGHKRVLGAESVGQKLIPVVYREFESIDQEKAASISDNATGQDSKIDLSIVNKLILDFDPIVLEDPEILGIPDFVPIAEDRYQDKDEDDIPHTNPNECGVKTGDLWILGEHRLICGDATKKEDVERLMDGQKADLGFCDPPYNLNFKYNSYDDNKSEQEYLDFCSSWFIILSKFSDKSIITPGTKNIYLWCQIDKPVHIGCWVKKNWISGCIVANLQQWEPILFFGKFGIKRTSDLYEINRVHQKDVGNDHSCPKQIELMIEIMKYSEKSVLDLFLGSGSTLIACEKTSRRCYACEIDPHYCSVIIRRWEKFTEQKAHKQE